MTPATPPKLPFRILRWFCKPWYAEVIEGDLLELYHRQVATDPAKARLAAYMNVIRFFRWRYIKDLEDFQPNTPFGMFKTYFKVTMRSMGKNKVQTTLNILGLSMAIAACLLILIHIKYQFAFDKHLPQFENIYRVTLNERGGNTPALLVKQMQADYPEVLNGTRISGPLESVISLQGRYIRQGGGIYADSTFFDLFPATFLAGRSGQVLSGPRDVVLTKRVSDKLFPNGEAVGEEINVDGDDYRITAVIENPPATSSIPYEFILSMPRESWVTNGWWTGNNFYSYLLVDPNVNIDQLESKFPDFVQRYIGPEILGFYDAYATLEDYFAEGHQYSFGLAPMKDIHLHHPRLSLGTGADYQSILTFGGVAVFILLIACINYVNMATARSSLRAKEIGMRKVMGSVKSLIAQQFLLESFVITSIAMAAGLVLALVCLPYFNQVSLGSYGIWDIVNLENALWFFLILIATSLLSGIYPALYLASFRPIAALKGETVKGGGSRMRSGLVIFQFSVSLLLMVGTYIVYQQISLMSNRKLGLATEQTYVIRDARKIAGDFGAFKNQLLSQAAISQVGLANGYPSGGMADWNYTSVDEDQIQLSPNNIFVSSEILEVWGLKLQSGRFFSANLGTDTMNIVVNETLVKTLGWEEPLGKMLGRSEGHFKIIGVVEDFALGSAKSGNAPVVFRYMNDGVFDIFGGDYLMVKIDGNLRDALEHIEATWDRFLPNYPLDGRFMDDSFQALYDGERRFGLLFSGFSVLAIVIASIGLFTLSAFVLERKRKEIAIRKVLGARVGQIFVRIIAYFGRLIIASTFIAVPVAFYLGHDWLDNYEERIDLSSMIFVIPLALLALISLVTVALQTYRMAANNPLDSLKEE